MKTNVNAVLHNFISYTFISEEKGDEFAPIVLLFKWRTKFFVKAI